MVVSGLLLVVKYLKCHFHKISLGVLRAILCPPKFFSNIRGGLRNKVGVENKHSCP
jgi:hypothetical protein